MATEKVFPMTQAGKEKLEQELEYLKSVKRKEVVERIKIARSFGDLSENSEYDSAKEEQAFVEGRITTLENTIRNAASSKKKKWPEILWDLAVPLLS